MIDSLEPMDDALADAARTGDYRFLAKRYVLCYLKRDYSYFCSRDTSMLPINEGKGGNIFHLSIWENQVDFFKQAMRLLPTKIVLRLLSHQEPFIGLEFSKANPLHIAALLGNLTIVKLILDFYRRNSNNNNSNYFDPDPPTNRKPWLAKDLRGRTPFHVALEKGKIECALEILSMDGSAATIDYNDGCSPLFLAVEKGYSKVALQILNSGHPYSLNGKHGSTPLHFAVRCSEEVYRRLLERHPQLLKERNHHGQTVMHTWICLASHLASHGTVWPFEYLLRSNDDINVPDQWRRDSLELIIANDEDDLNPLHCTAIYRDSGVARILVEAYEKERAKESSIFSREVIVPWLTPNKRGETPLDMAIDNDFEEVALCFLTPEINSVLHGPDNPLFRAIQKKRYKVAEQILAQQEEFSWIPGLSSGHGRNVLHDASKYTEEIATWLVTRFRDFISKADKDGKTPLHEASKAGADWLIELMLKTNQSSLEDASKCEKAPLPWVEACKNGHVSTIKAFINNCPYFRDHCLEHEDTPLHHIKLGGYTEYKEFLEITIIKELKDTQNSDGETPLHLAIMTDNMSLAETLVTTHGKDWRTKNNSKKTALDLLAQKCAPNSKWEKMCKRVGINPKLKMTYVQHEISLLDMRSTLSVVAALLATITFTAGFTLPGGFDSKSGESILAKKAAFLVFLISDTYAMCCSMLVLFCLIWSMVSNHDKSLLLIDQGMVILLQSLYGTLVAFMTGVAAVIFHKSFWAAILIFAMCFLVALVATVRKILFNLLDKLVPSADEHGFQSREQQLGNLIKCFRATPSRNPNDTTSNV